ncbi:non-hydrolyzing UDP-N-acetylglucosamine 2-epimerase [Solitalea canadensis]|uniref:UDP-N-acetylglucosamine 2-epimerase n=1 Tax=Solitalea canadensis (strain ATCC 29591 / DSM 3403 / JCM 21819 / LMG 8368 / NBRC 15130 / NCIMB 12057 / USAM 9D) TaxID=929556 RepID=H8KMC1_SOLCM|nr:UDP-N-acetylglucosamine 2-epimerase (non-hydrolyzing) [Solitalea canadensis]AFD09303.1 UDP-N-acetylglucosamine 2-epimerase [Solitalea canadensis DSM 3403]
MTDNNTYNTKFKLILVAGARPNFMKIAPLMHALRDNRYIHPILVHTGQHYDEKMSDLFFKQLSIPNPDVNLEVGSGSHATQTARIMEGFEKVCLDIKPDMVLVVGDVNSTVACTLVASKLGIRTAHYEAGLRSHDRSMPEEINRLVTDSISDYFFTTSQDADANLLKEGVDKEKIHMVGNLMIDTLIKALPHVDNSCQTFNLLNKDQLIQMGRDIVKGNYGIMTFHRPSNVDNKEVLAKLVSIWGGISSEIPLVFPIHPRTFKNIVEFGLLERINNYKNLFLIESLGYFEFIGLVKDSLFVLTDSGGIQEETTHLNIPCLTVRPNTERPVTITEGSNELIKIDEIEANIRQILNGFGKSGRNPKYWDGNTANRIINIIENTFELELIH